MPVPSTAPTRPGAEPGGTATAAREQAMAPSHTAGLEPGASDDPAAPLPVRRIRDLDPHALTLAVPRSGLPAMPEVVRAVEELAARQGHRLSPRALEGLPGTLLLNYRYLGAGFILGLDGVELRIRLETADPLLVARAAGAYDGRSLALVPEEDEPDTASVTTEGGSASDTGKAPDRPLGRFPEPEEAKPFHANEAVNSLITPGAVVKGYSAPTEAFRVNGAASFGIGVGRIGLGVSQSYATSRSTTTVSDAEQGRVAVAKTDSEMVALRATWRIALRTGTEQTGTGDAPVTVEAAETDRLLVQVPQYYLEPAPARQVVADGDRVRELLKQVPPVHFAAGLTGLPKLFDGIVALLREQGLSLRVGSATRDELVQKLWDLEAHLEEAAGSGYLITLHNRYGQPRATVLVRSERSGVPVLVGAVSDKAAVEDVRTAIAGVGSGDTKAASTRFALSGSASPLPAGPNISLELARAYSTSVALGVGRTGLSVEVLRVKETAGYRVGWTHTAVVSVAGRGPRKTDAVPGEGHLRVPVADAFRHGLPVGEEALADEDGPAAPASAARSGTSSTGTAGAPRAVPDTTELRRTLGAHDEGLERLPAHAAYGRGFGTGVLTVGKDTARALHDLVYKAARGGGYVPADPEAPLSRRDLGDPLLRHQLENQRILSKFLNPRALGVHESVIRQDGLLLELMVPTSSLGVITGTRVLSVLIKARPTPGMEPEFRGTTDAYTLVHLDIGQDTARFSESSSRRTSFSAGLRGTDGVLRSGGFGASGMLQSGVAQSRNRLTSLPTLQEYGGADNRVFTLHEDYEALFRETRNGLSGLGRRAPGTYGHWWPPRSIPLPRQQATVLLYPVGTSQGQAAAVPTPSRLLEHGVVHYVDTTGLYDAVVAAVPDTAGRPGGPAEKFLRTLLGPLTIRTHLPELLTDGISTDQVFEAGFVRNEHAAVHVSAELGASTFVGATSEPFVSGNIALGLTQANNEQSDSRGVQLTLPSITLGGVVSGSASVQGGLDAAWGRQWNAATVTETTGATEEIRLPSLGHRPVYFYRAQATYALKILRQESAKLLPTRSRSGTTTVGDRQVVYGVPEWVALRAYGRGELPVPDRQLVDVMNAWSRGEVRLSGDTVAALLVRWTDTTPDPVDTASAGPLARLTASRAELADLLWNMHGAGELPLQDDGVLRAFAARFGKRAPDGGVQAPLAPVPDGPRTGLPDYLTREGSRLLGHSAVHKVVYDEPGRTPLAVVTELVNRVAPGALSANPEVWSAGGRHIGSLQGLRPALEGLLGGKRPWTFAEELFSPDGMTLYFPTTGLPRAGLGLEIVGLTLRAVTGAFEVGEFLPNTGLEHYRHGGTTTSRTVSRDATVSVSARFGGGDGDGAGSFALMSSAGMAAATHSALSRGTTETNEQTAYAYDPGTWRADARFELHMTADILKMRPGWSLNDLIASAVRRMGTSPHSASGVVRGTIALQVPNAVATFRPGYGPFLAPDPRPLPPLPGDAYVTGLSLEDIRPAADALWKRLFDVDPQTDRVPANSAVLQLSNPTQLAALLPQAQRGPVALGKALFVTGRSGERADLSLRLHGFSQLRVLGRFEGEIGTGRYGKSLNATTASAGIDDWRPSAGFNALGVAVTPTHDNLARTNGGEAPFSRVTGATTTDAVGESYRREQHLKQLGPATWRVEVTARLSLIAQKRHEGLFVTYSDPPAESRPVTGRVELQLHEGELEQLLRLWEQTPEPAALRPKDWAALDAAVRAPLDLVPLLRRAATARGGTLTRLPETVLHAVREAKGRGLGAIAFTLDRADLVRMVHAEVLNWAAATVEADLATGRGTAEDATRAHQLLSQYRDRREDRGAAATEDELYTLIREVNEVHGALRQDTGPVGPVSLPDALRYVELNWDHWLRVFAHEAGVPVRLELTFTGPGGRFHRWAEPSGRVHAFDPRQRADVPKLTVEQARRAGLLTPEQAEAVRDTDLTPVELAQAYRTSWAGGRTFAEAVLLEVDQRLREQVRQIFRPLPGEGAEALRALAAVLLRGGPGARALVETGAGYVYAVNTRGTVRFSGPDGMPVSAVTLAGTARSFEIDASGTLLDRESPDGAPPVRQADGEKLSFPQLRLGADLFGFMRRYGPKHATAVGEQEGRTAGGPGTTPMGRVRVLDPIPEEAEQAGVQEEGTWPDEASAEDVGRLPGSGSRDDGPHDGDSDDDDGPDGGGPGGQGPQAGGPYDGGTPGNVFLPETPDPNTEPAEFSGAAAPDGPALTPRDGGDTAVAHSAARAVGGSDADVSPAVDYRLVHPDDIRHVVESLPGELLWRFSDTEPEVVFRVGFRADDPSERATVDSWVRDNPPGPYVSSTRDDRLHWQGKRYRYEINTSRNPDATGPDVDATSAARPGANPYSLEHEVAFTRSIPPEAMLLVYDYELDRIGTWDAETEQVRWEPGEYSYADARPGVLGAGGDGSTDGTAGLPDGREASGSVARPARGLTVNRTETAAAGPKRPTALGTTAGAAPEAVDGLAPEATRGTVAEQPHRPVEEQQAEPAAPTPSSISVARFGTPDGANALAHVEPVPQETVVWLQDLVAGQVEGGRGRDEELRAAVRARLTAAWLSSERARLLDGQGAALPVPHQGRTHLAFLRLALSDPRPGDPAITRMPGGNPVNTQSWAFGIDAPGSTASHGTQAPVSADYAHTFRPASTGQLPQVTLSPGLTFTLGQRSSTVTTSWTDQPMLLLRSREPSELYNYRVAAAVHVRVADSSATRLAAYTTLPTEYVWREAPGRIGVWWPEHLAEDAAGPAAETTGNPERRPAPMELLKRVPLFAVEDVPYADRVLRDVLTTYRDELANISEISLNELRIFFGEGQLRANAPLMADGWHTSPTLYDESGEIIGMFRVRVALSQRTGPNALAGPPTRNSVLESHVLRSVQMTGSTRVVNRIGASLAIGLGWSLGTPDPATSAEPPGLTVTGRVGLARQDAVTLGSGNGGRTSRSLRTTRPLLRVWADAAYDIRLVRPHAPEDVPASGTPLAGDARYPVILRVPSEATVAGIPGGSARHLPPEIAHLRSLDVSVTPLSVDGVSPLFDRLEDWLRGHGFLPPGLPGDGPWLLGNARRLAWLRSAPRYALADMTQGGQRVRFTRPSATGERTVSVVFTTERRHVPGRPEGGVVHEAELPHVQTLNYSGSAVIAAGQSERVPWAFTGTIRGSLTGLFGGAAGRWLREITPEYDYGTQRSTAHTGESNAGHEFYALDPDVHIFGVPAVNSMRIWTDDGVALPPEQHEGWVRLALPAHRTRAEPTTAEAPARPRPRPRTEADPERQASAQRLPETAVMDRFHGSEAVREAVRAMFAEAERTATAEQTGAGTPQERPRARRPDDADEYELPPVPGAYPAEPAAQPDDGPAAHEDPASLRRRITARVADTFRRTRRLTTGERLTAPHGVVQEIVDAALSPHHFLANAYRILNDSYVVELHGAGSSGLLSGLQARIEVKGHMTNVRTLSRPETLDWERWVQSVDASEYTVGSSSSHAFGLAVAGVHGGPRTSVAPAGRYTRGSVRNDATTVQDNATSLRVTSVNDEVRALHLGADVRLEVNVVVGRDNAVASRLAGGPLYEGTYVVDVEDGLGFLLSPDDHPGLRPRGAPVPGPLRPADRRLPDGFVRSGGQIGYGSVVEVLPEGGGRSALADTVRDLVEKTVPGATVPGSATYVPGVGSYINGTTTALGLHTLVGHGPAGRTAGHFVTLSPLGMPLLVEIVLNARPADGWTTVLGHPVSGKSGLDNILGHTSGDGSVLPALGATRQSGTTAHTSAADLSLLVSEGGHQARLALSGERQTGATRTATSLREERLWQRSMGEQSVRQYRLPYEYGVTVTARVLDSSSLLALTQLLGTAAERTGLAHLAVTATRMLPGAVRETFERLAGLLPAPHRQESGTVRAEVVIRFNESETLPAPDPVPPEATTRPDRAAGTTGAEPGPGETDLGGPRQIRPNQESEPAEPALVTPAVYTEDPAMPPGGRPGEVVLDVRVPAVLRARLDGPRWEFPRRRPLALYDFDALPQFADALRAVHPGLGALSGQHTSVSREAGLLRLVGPTLTGLPTRLTPAAVTQYLGQPVREAATVQVSVHDPVVTARSADTAIDRVRIATDGSYARADGTTTALVTASYSGSLGTAGDDRLGAAGPLVGGHLTEGQTHAASAPRREMGRFGTAMARTARGVPGYLTEVVLRIEVTGPTGAKRWVVGNARLRTTVEPPARDRTSGAEPAADSGSGPWTATAHAIARPTAVRMAKPSGVRSAEDPSSRPASGTDDRALSSVSGAAEAAAPRAHREPSVEDEIVALMRGTSSHVRSGPLQSGRGRSARPLQAEVAGAGGANRTSIPDAGHVLMGVPLWSATAPGRAVGHDYADVVPPGEVLPLNTWATCFTRQNQDTDAETGHMLPTPWHARAPFGQTPYFALISGTPDLLRVRTANGMVTMAGHVLADHLATVPGLRSLPADVPVVLLMAGGASGRLDLPRLVAARTGREVWAHSGDIRLRRTQDGRNLLITVVNYDDPSVPYGQWVRNLPDDLGASSAQERATVLPPPPEPLTPSDGRTISTDSIQQFTVVGRDGRPVGRASHTTADWAVAESVLIRRPLDAAQTYVQAYWPSPTSEPITLPGTERPLPWRVTGTAPYYVNMHGTPDEVDMVLTGGDIVPLDGRQLGRFLRRRPSLSSRPADDPIVLVSCSTGGRTTAPQGNVAQLVADETQRVVYAPDEGTSVGLRMEGDRYGNPGLWLTFYPRWNRHRRPPVPDTGRADHPPSSTT
ncbi:hypothetical protein [Streptomyces rubrogriseus]|uniref:scabin-related ADP-ribosyltransferase n=1 Tax=Streptomyces rubrogriseus TaxID=194673 RepID=UPI001942D88E|nr:hypothetical protein [Streptomyces rubrogriseus]